MPYAYQISETDKVVFAVFEGTVTTEEFWSYRSELANDPAWKPGFDQLVDVRKISDEVVTVEETRSLAGGASEAIHPRLGDGKLAIVVATDLHYGIARMYEVQSGDSPRPVQTFRDIAPALEWLGLKAL